METRRPIVIPSALSNRLWARARARGDVSWVIVCSRRSRCVSSRGCTYRTVGTLSCGVASETKVWITLYTSRYYAKKLLVRHLWSVGWGYAGHGVPAHTGCAVSAAIPGRNSAVPADVPHPAWTVSLQKICPGGERLGERLRHAVVYPPRVEGHAFALYRSFVLSARDPAQLVGQRCICRRPAGQLVRRADRLPGRSSHAGAARKRHGIPTGHAAEIY